MRWSSILTKWSILLMSCKGRRLLFSVHHCRRGAYRPFQWVNCRAKSSHRGLHMNIHSPMSKFRKLYRILSKKCFNHILRMSKRWKFRHLLKLHHLKNYKCKWSSLYHSSRSWLTVKRNKVTIFGVKVLKSCQSICLGLSCQKNSRSWLCALSPLIWKRIWSLT